MEHVHRTCSGSKAHLSVFTCQRFFVEYTRPSLSRRHPTPLHLYQFSFQKIRNDATHYPTATDSHLSMW